MDTFVKTPVLETKRLTLRPLRKSDAGLIDLYAGDLRVSRMTTSIAHPNPPGATEAFLEKVMDPSHVDQNWAIDATKGFGVEVLGVFTLRNDGELGYWTGPFFWGLGIATEAGEAVIDYAQSRGIARIHARHFDDNPASGRVMQKLGMTPTGVTDTAFCVARGETVQQVQYERRIDVWR